ncbi:HD-GYP domain-containing protein [Paenibacillus sp. N3.4]|uniref:HD-GYP domain-containing protein n=1 Tax=Paenibacillus sp. N3.4 TaxID=2603222 RepID=UPI0011C9BBA0|nr:HD domain-containing phosphohydrolase [Paenibacillus sp. N3.4]TXK86071.1 HD domain-containing protein [Paenibacillus sp. N3.4]
MEYLTLASSYAGKSLESALLTNEIEETQKEIIFRMGEIGESRSKETGNHVKRVAEYSYLLALALGLSQEEADLLKMASPMHDIGKVAIPDSVLNKPGKLTDEEFKLMQNHTVIGYNLLKQSTRKILTTAATVAYEHHEKWNGRGYPRGIKGEDIHIFGRITAIADVFDALGSERVYKKAWELDRILTLFKEERGEHFDPKVVDIFFEQLPAILLVREHYSDAALENSKDPKET